MSNPNSLFIKLINAMLAAGYDPDGKVNALKYQIDDLSLMEDYQLSDWQARVCLRAAEYNAYVEGFPVLAIPDVHHQKVAEMKKNLADPNRSRAMTHAESRARKREAKRNGTWIDK